MAKRILLFIFLLFSVLTASAHKVSLSVKDKTTGEPVLMALSLITI